jgi:hypothetical protein
MKASTVHYYTVGSPRSSSSCTSREKNCEQALDQTKAN